MLLLLAALLPADVLLPFAAVLLLLEAFLPADVLLPFAALPLFFRAFPDRVFRPEALPARAFCLANKISPSSHQR